MFGGPTRRTLTVRHLTVKHCGLSFVNGTYKLAGEFKGHPKYEHYVTDCEFQCPEYECESIPPVVTIIL